MARIDTLGHFLTDVASAIKTKKGSQTDIQASDFDTEITNLPSGGGVEKSDVTFYDFDGTIVASYTKSDFLALSALPDNPTHEGLTAQGWNWTLSEAQTYVTSYGKLNIGQNYTTSDGKTKIYIKLDENALSPYIGFAVNGAVTVDWGDGNTSTVTGTSTSTVIYTQHTYQSAGEYIISLDSASTIYLSGDGNVPSSKLLTNGSSSMAGGQCYRNAIKHVRLSSNVNIGNVTFASCYKLETITIPNNIILGSSLFISCYSLQHLTLPKPYSTGVTSIGGMYNCYNLKTVCLAKGYTGIGYYAFQYDYALESVTFPDTITSSSPYVFQNCFTLKEVILPSCGTSLQQQFFQYCASLQEFTIPSDVTTTGNNAVEGCKSLEKLIIPEGFTRANQQSFNDCHSLTYVKFPSTISNLGNSAFANNYSIQYYDFTDCTSVPSATSSSFNNIPSQARIVVPDDLYDTWKATSGWSNYSSKIIKESEWTH